MVKYVFNDYEHYLAKMDKEHDDDIYEIASPILGKSIVLQDRKTFGTLEDLITPDSQSNKGVLGSLTETKCIIRLENDCYINLPLCKILRVNNINIPEKYLVKKD